MLTLIYRFIEHAFIIYLFSFFLKYLKIQKISNFEFSNYLGLRFRPGVNQKNSS